MAGKYAAFVLGHGLINAMVVANADAHVSKDLLPIEQSRFVRPPEPVSMSGWTESLKSPLQRNKSGSYGAVSRRMNLSSVTSSTETNLHRNQLSTCALKHSAINEKDGEMKLYLP